METASELGSSGRSQPGATHLPQEAHLHLRAALGQMDLLLHTQDRQEALRYLLAMLRHLRTVRRYVA